MRNHTPGNGSSWPVLVGEVHSETSYKAPRFAVNANNMLAASVWSTYYNTGITALYTWYVLAMSLNQSTKQCKFYVDGVLVATQSFTSSGSKVHISGSVNNTSTDIRSNTDVYYAAIVNKVEDDAAIQANSKCIKAYYFDNIKSYDWAISPNSGVAIPNITKNI